MLLLIVFTAATALAVARGGSNPCNCFRSSTKPIGTVHVIRNILLLAVAAIGLTADRADQLPSLPEAASPGSQPQCSR